MHHRLHGLYDSVFGLTASLRRQTARPVLSLAVALLAPAAFGATTWDANTSTTGAQDGAGTWDLTTANWWNGTADAVWPNTTTSIATIGAASGTAGTITLSGSVTLNQIGFAAATSGNYTLSGGSLSFGGTTPSISIAASLTPVINSVIGESTAGTAIKFSATGIGSGNITLGGANTFSGSPTVSQATVIFKSLANGGVASSFGAGANTVPIIVGNNGSSAAATYTGPAAATDRPFNFNGAGSGNALNNNGTGAISLNNTGPTMAGTAGNRTLTLGGSYVATANTFAQSINDMPGFVSALKIAGNWNLTGASTFSGGITLSSGTLGIGNASALGSGAITVGGTASFDNTSGSPLTLANGLTLSGGNPTFIGSAGLTLSGPVSLSGANRTITVNANMLTLAGVIGDAGAGLSLTKAGNGTLTVLGLNTYSGGTVLSGAGTLLVTNDAALGNAGTPITFSGSGFLGATNAAAGVNNTVTISSARTITVNSGVTAGFTTPDTNNLVVAAKITGSGAVTKRSTSTSLGTVRFSNDTSDFTGDFGTGYGNTEFTSVADQGTASSLGAGAAGSRGTITLGNGASFGILRYVGANNSATHRPLNWTGTTGPYTLEASGSGTLQFLATDALKSGAGAATLTLRGTNTGSNTLAQTIADSGGATSLTKNDAGTWILTGANSYSGATTVSGGALVVNGSLTGAGAVTVQNNATLGGNGTIAGVVTVNAGGTLAPGVSANSAATLTLQAAPTLNGTLALALYKSGASLTADHLALGANSLAFGGTLAVTANGDALAAGDSFQLFSAASYSGSFSTVTLPALGANLAWDTSSLAVDGMVRVASLGAAPTVLVLPASTNIECGGSVSLDAVATGSPAPTLQWYDNHGNAVAAATGATLTLTSVHSAQAGTWTVVANNSLGSATNSAVLGVNDSTAPAISCPANISVVTTDAAGANVSFTVTATDTCDPAPTLVSTPASGSFFAAGTNTVLSVATDSSGNSNTCSFLVVVDRAPVVQTNLSATVVQDATLSLEFSNLVAVVTDADNDTLSVSSVEATSTNGGTVTLTSTNVLYQPVAGYSGTDLLSYVVTDGRGGLATNSVTVNVLSSNEFIVTVTPASTNAECASAVSFSAQTAATAPLSFQWYDNAGNPVTDATNATFTLANVHAAQNGSWTVVMTTAFAQVTNSATLSVVDTTAPVITLNGNNPMVVEAGSQFSDPGATALDACAGSVSVTVSGTVNASQPGSYTLTYSADDSSGNVGQATRTVSVVDTTAPVITCPPDIAVVTTNATGTTVSFTVTATDASGSAPTVVSTPASGSFFAAGTNTVVSVATDASGNSNTCSFLVVVDRAPVVQTNLSTSLVQDTTLSLEFSNLVAVVTDADNDALSVSSVEATSTNGGTVTLTSTNVLYQPVAGYSGLDLLSYVVTDGRGGLATNTVSLNVLSTNEFIVTVTPASTNAECASAVSFTAQSAATAPLSFQWYDNAGHPVVDATNATFTLANVHAAQNGSWTVVMTSAFAQVTNSATLSVVDTTAPVITLNGANPLVMEAGSQFSDPGATALDACAGSVSVTVSGTVNASQPGSYTLTYSADDGSGNVSQTNRTVTVVDTIAPVITCPADIAVVTTNAAGATVSFTVTATDSVDPAPTVVSTPASGSFFPAGTNTVVSVATDASGNSNTCSFLVVVDRAPVVQTNVVAYVAQNQTLTLTAAKLLAVASDLDSDPLMVAGADVSSTNGGGVTLTGTTLTYHPATDFVGADLFSYTISDGRGGLATNSVAISVVSSNLLSPNVVFGPVLTNGQFVVRFAGVPGYTYTVEVTHDPINPVWTKLTNLTASPTEADPGVGSFELRDNRSAAENKYYRTVYPAY